jgi:hypothetical protein
MMEPIVRLMVPCEDARPRRGRRNKIDIFGAITVINAPADAFPVRLTFCVYLCLTDGHGGGTGKIVVVNDDSDVIVFDGDERAFDFGNDPTALYASTIAIPLCAFPTPGIYRIEFVYNGTEVGRCFVHVRESS